MDRLAAGVALHAKLEVLVPTVVIDEFKRNRARAETSMSVGAVVFRVLMSSDAGSECLKVHGSRGRRCMGRRSEKSNAEPVAGGLGAGGLVCQRTGPAWMGGWPVRLALEGDGAGS